MIRQVSTVITDATGKEFLKEQTQAFNFIANSNDIHNYIASRVQAHWHKEIEVFTLLSGDVKVDINDQCYTLHTGQGCFINSNVLHTFTAISDSPCLFHSLVFNTDILSGVVGSVFDTRYVRPVVECGPAFHPFYSPTDDAVFFQSLDRAFSACEEERYGYELAIRNALSDMWLYISQSCKLTDSATLPDAQELRIRTILEWLPSHLTEIESVEEIAAHANICVRECQRLFKRYLHTTPMEYVRTARIYQAADLLAHTDLPITDIAIACGFSSHSHFTKHFRLVVGTTPSAYRISTKSQMASLDES